jgi:hypothetical protein
MPAPDELAVFITFSFADVERIASSARWMRDALHLSPQDAVPILDVLEFRVVEALKNFRFVVDLDDNFDRSVLAKARRIPMPEIVVRESVYQHATIDSGAARVVLAHELGHLWLGHVEPSDGYSAFLEWQADEFAAELLMPGTVAVEMDAERIERQFSVPLRTAKVRLQTLRNRQRDCSAIFEKYSGLLSRFEKEVLKWVPASSPAASFSEVSLL